MSENDNKEKHNAWARWLKPVLLSGIIVLLAGVLFFNIPGFSPKLDSKITHYAVALNNGLMFFGHPESVGRGSVVLTDVYYVVVRQTRRTIKDTKLPFPGARVSGIALTG